MSRSFLLGMVLMAVLPASGSLLRAEEEEPALNGKKLTYWMELLSEGKDARSRIRGLTALELIGHDASRKVVPALVKSLRQDKDPAVRAAAARTVGRTIARALAKAREDKKEELPRFDAARDALATAVRTEQASNVRAAAALALGDLGTDARGAVGTLALALKDKSPETVNAAALALRRLGRDAREAQIELQTLVADKKASLEARVDAALCLGQIRPDVTQALPIMREVLADDSTDSRIRRALADSLGKLGRDGVDATPTLATLLSAKDTSPELRLAAVTAIDQFGPEARAAIPALIKVIGDPDLLRTMGENARFIRCLAMQSLGRMGKDLDKYRKEAVTTILKATEDVSVEVCVSAIETLGALATEGLGGQTEEVNKRLETILLREGRKVIREAAQAAQDKLRPKKAK